MDLAAGEGRDHSVEDGRGTCSGMRSVGPVVPTSGYELKEETDVTLCRLKSVIYN